MNEKSQMTKAGRASKADMLTVVFSETGDFDALNAARAWCEERGVSYGSTDRTGTIGLLVGDFAIAKWHNLTAREKRECHGTITGDGRHGPLTLRISRAALDVRGSDAALPPELTPDWFAVRSRCALATLHACRTTRGATCVRLNS